MASTGRGKFFGSVVLVGLVVGVAMGVVGRMLDLPTAVIGGVTGALVAVSVVQMRKQA